MTAPSMATNPEQHKQPRNYLLLPYLSNHGKYLETRFIVSGLAGAIGFPLYYLVWHNLFPQPYENLPLRLLGSLFLLPTILAKQWPESWQRYLPIYWHFAILYALPFFFTFMLLKNHGNSIWLMSSLSALFLFILIVDWRALIALLIIGAVSAVLAYKLSTSADATNAFRFEYLPIFLFTVILGTALNHRADTIRKERFRAMRSTASTLAHELRTPLLGIKAGANGLQQHLAALLEGYQQAKLADLPVLPIRNIHQEQLNGVLKRIEEEVDHSNIIIDMLLANSDLVQFKQIAFTSCNMQTCLADALRRYPFASDQQRMLVHADLQIAFHFRGHELLMVHLLFNLLKNALRHITQAGKGEILIRSESGPEQNRLIFHDTGPGIPAHILPHIFTRFYSWSLGHDDGSGAGIGLAYCRSVMQAFGGSINCRSQSGEFCEFTLSFPR